jgi:hypothetical protein
MADHVGVIPGSSGKSVIAYDTADDIDGATVAIQNADGTVDPGDVFNLATPEGRKAYVAKLQSLGVRPSDLPSFVTSTEAGLDMADMPPAQLAKLKALAASIAGLSTGQTSPTAMTHLQGEWADFVAQSKLGTTMDVNALVEFVLRESYLQTNKDLEFFAQKVKFFNELKQAMRDELTRLRTVETTLAPFYNQGTAGAAGDGSVDLDKAAKATPPTATDAHGTAYSNDNPYVNADPPYVSDPNDPDDKGDGKGGVRRYADENLNGDMGGGVYMFDTTIPGPDGKVRKTLDPDALKDWAGPGGKDKLETAIKNLEEKLNSAGDDAQLANTDLQGVLQK